MAAEQGLSVDEDGFRRLMTEQRDRAKADAKAKKGSHADATAYREVADALGRPVEFTGYNEVVSEGAVRGLSSTAASVPSAGEGDEIELVLDRTPFYAEGGGQLADQGVIELANGARLEVLDVQSPDHRAGRPPGDGADRRGHASGRRRSALVDVERRLAISPRAHGDPHGAQGVPRGARRDRDPGRLGERPGPVPVRLLRHRRGAGSR